MTTAAPLIERVITGRPRDLGDGFVVRRTLPSPERRALGPFVFLDQVGPVALAPGAGLDVRPHPHIALATVTYLFAGALMHRDSLGSVQEVGPGDLGWMVAGAGIVHSERTPPHLRAAGHRLHGLQAWVALPRALEACPPSFAHHAAATLPTLARDGVRGTVIAGTAFGLRSPAAVASDTLYVDVALAAGATLEVPPEHAERGVYVVSGSVDAAEARALGEGALAVLRDGASVAVRAATAARVMLIGGAPLDGERLLEWNFVASTRERLEQAKADWRARRFPLVPGDEAERIPLPGDPD